MWRRSEGLSGEANQDTHTHQHAPTHPCTHAHMHALSTGSWRRQPASHHSPKPTKPVQRFLGGGGGSYNASWTKKGQGRGGDKGSLSAPVGTSRCTHWLGFSEHWLGFAEKQKKIVYIACRKTLGESIFKR